MQIHNAIITGSFSYNGADLSNVTSSNQSSASLSSRTTDLESTSSVLVGASASFSSVLTSVSSSQQQISASLLQVSASYTALSGSYNTFSGSASTRITENSSSIQQVSSSQQQISASLLNVISIFATTGSNSFRANQSITGSLVVSSTITAQTLVVQTVTSSIVYSSGSNVFGCDINSRQTFTGSFYQTGSSMNINAGCVIIGNTTSPACDFFFNVTTVCAGTNATVAQFYNAEYTSGTRGFIRIRNSANIGATTSAYIGQGQDSKTYIYNNDPSRAGDIVISASGLVGMNTCAPIAQLHVKTSVASGNRPTNLATSATNSAVYFTTIDGSGAGIAFGQIGANTNYIQATYENGSAATPLSLNPYGGNVGIATVSPCSTFDVVVGASGERRLLINYDDSVITIKGASNTTAPEALRLIGDNIRFNIGTTGSGSEAMRITLSGYVGIGTDCPSAKLTIIRDSPFNTGDQALRIRACNSDGYNLWMGASVNGYATIQSYQDNVGGASLLLNPLNGGNVGINNSSPMHNLDIGSVRTNTGGFAFCNMVTAQSVFSTFACVGSDANVVTTITYTNTNDHNRSGVFIARWAYNTACAALHIVSCLWNDSQNINQFSLRNNAGALQICVSGGGGDYRVQALTQGTKAT